MIKQEGGEVVIGILDLLLIASIFSMYKYGKNINCDNEEDSEEYLEE